MIATETRSQHSKGVTKIGGTVYEKTGYRMDVNLWFRHKNEALFYIDSAGRVHGPMDKNCSTRLGPIQKSGKEISFKKEYSEHLENDQWQKTMEIRNSQPREIRQDIKHFETVLHNVSTNDIGSHKKTHMTLANHYIPNYKNIETTSYSSTITKQNKKPDQGVTVNIIAPKEEVVEKDSSVTRERRLIDELLEARRELNTLRKTRSVMDNSFIGNDSTNFTSEHHVSKVVTDVYPSNHTSEKIKKRHHSTHQESQKTPDWSYRENSLTRRQAPHVQRNDMHESSTYNTYIREKETGPISNYSARKENMKTQQLMDGRCGSMRTLPLDRRMNEMTEEIETITLQPIGKGVQDLAPGFATISRPPSRAATPRAYDVNGGLASQSSYTREEKQTSGYSTMPSMPKFNKYSSARNVNQTSSYDIPDSYRRGTSTGRTNQDQVISSTWQKRSESYTSGNRNFQSNISPLTNHESMMNTKTISSGYEEGRFPLQVILNTEDIWYQPNLSREDVILALRDKEAGSFIIRNSSSFAGAYGLALKVDILPENVVRTNDIQRDLIRHFLIETVDEASGPGVRLKGLTNEPIYPSLAHLVQDHCHNPRALPIKLLIQNFSLSKINHEDSGIVQSQYQYDSYQKQQFGTSKSQLLSNAQRSLSSPGVNFIDMKHPNPLHRHFVTNAVYLGKVDVDRLVGKAAVEHAVTKIMSKKSLKTTTTEIQLDSTNGITIIDKVQALFYTRQFPVQHVISVDFDPRSREFTSPVLQNNGISRGRILGLVVRKQKMILRENVVHLFCEIDKSNNLNNIISFINDNYLRRA